MGGMTDNWSLFMRWHDLLFMHWPVPAKTLRPQVPSQLKLDTFDGDAWIGIVPFRMSKIRHRVIPPIPGLSSFPELNVRTYVTHRGKPGVWFFSLDAANKIAVRTARWLFNLPYYDALMICRREGESVEYRSTRTHDEAPACGFQGEYGPTGPVFKAAKGSLDAFLTDRLCLYSVDRLDDLYRVDIEHRRWPLQPAEVEVKKNTMVRPLGVKLPKTRPLLHFARQLDVRAWMPQRV